MPKKFPEKTWHFIFCLCVRKKNLKVCSTPCMHVLQLLKQSSSSILYIYQLVINKYCSNYLALQHDMVVTWTLNMYPFFLDLTEKYSLTLNLIDMYDLTDTHLLTLILLIFFTLDMHTFTLDYEVPFGT